MGYHESGTPFFIIIIMSSQKPTDTDHEILKLLRWVRENYLIAQRSPYTVEWMNREQNSFHADSVVLDIYQKQKK